MSIGSRLVAWLAKLPPAETFGVAVDKDIPVPMRDGVMLLADHYYPRGGAKRPTILLRSPYGRAGLMGIQYGRPYAERGFQVLIQSCRGTFGSGGDFNPLVTEQADGLTTIEWIKQQDWFNGQLATSGPSYLGYVQWALAGGAGPELKAMALQVTASELRDPTYAGGSFSLHTILSWANLMQIQESSPLSALAGMYGAERKLKRLFNHLPLCELDQLALGKPLPFWREWLEHNAPDDPYWTGARDHSSAVPKTRVPISMVDGWYDIFLPWLLRDYATLVKAGNPPYLTIGPWSHTQPGLMAEGSRDTLAWLRAQLLGDRSCLRAQPVRLFIMGANEWREYPAWPPPGYSPQPWYLHSERGLGAELPGESEPDGYRYDPSDPTPSVGGAFLTSEAGPRDNRALEARPDVLTYTSAALAREVEVIGPVQVNLFAASTLEHADFFARLCDVDPSGRSTNICDALLRTQPGQPPRAADGSMRVSIDLSPTAHLFKRGHRIRLQVSSGAHPRYARNTGSGEPLATATKLIAAHQTIYHDPAHPSAVVLPVSR